MEYSSPLNKHGVKCFNVPGLGEKLSDTYHISSAVVLPANMRTVVTAGQTGYTADMKLPTDLTEQYLQAFQNVVDSLAAAGVTDGFNSVYQMTSYHVGLDAAADKALEVVVEKFLGKNRFAWAGVGVEALADGARVEITAYAVLPN
ncbi:endoribonuclease l-psp [Lophium mytilinum]|uniref:Endoribonuclease l-psp n=1 Tax=Lophium mytilinum TaxID=390894 RepID=A0A6A6RBP9_9PEZI|nr:endoribonuclease l-psp [Lophium mytilinum]